MTLPAPIIGPTDAALAIWTDIAPELEGEFNEWYWREHMPERLAVPGFRRGRRHRAISGGPRYFACYDLASAAVLTSLAYRERLDNPTAWTRRIMPGFRTTTRAALRVVAMLGRVAGAAALTVRVTPRQERLMTLTDHLKRVLMPALHARAGILRLFLSEAIVTPPGRRRAKPRCEAAAIPAATGS